MLKNAFYNNDIVFYGHDHISEIQQSNINDSNMNLIMGGRFNLDINQPTSFNVVIFETHTRKLTALSFNWNIENRIFIQKQNKNISLENNSLNYQKAFFDYISKDNQNICDYFTEYYCFPNLEARGGTFSVEKYPRNISVDDIFDVVLKDKNIKIIGESGSGKTNLLYYLYIESFKHGFYPIIIQHRDYRNRNIESLFHNLFSEQYDNHNNTCYEIYKQTPSNKKLILIDDIDFIENSGREELLKYILNSNMLLIYTSRENIDNLEDVAKEILQKKTIGTIEILPFYKRKRDELIEKVCKIKGKKQEEIDNIIEIFDYLIQCQTAFFTFTPANILQYIKYLVFEANIKERKIIQNISIVFETNIRNSIIKVAKDSYTIVYLSALEYIADHMYFEDKVESLKMNEFEEIVKKFNEAKATNINPIKFYEDCIKAEVLKKGNLSFEISFFDNNTYAYFVARSINRSYEKDPSDFSKITHIMEHICFGINSTIILFLSFIRSNSKIIIKIVEEANQLMHDYEEWNIATMNIPLLHETIKIPSSVPSNKEKEEIKKEKESVEMKRHSDVVKYKSIFNYNEKDINLEKYKILRALKYIEIIGCALIDQYGEIDKNDLKNMINSIYTIPQKIIFAILTPVQERVDDIVSNFKTYILKSKNQEVDDIEIRKALALAGTMLSLNIMNHIAFNSVNENTINALTKPDDNNINYSILQLMMVENLGNTPKFIEQAIRLNELMEQKKCFYAQILIKQIVRKHILCSSEIDYKLKDKLVSKKILSSESRKALTAKQGEKKKN